MSKSTTQRRIQRKYREQRQDAAIALFFESKIIVHSPVKTGRCEKGYLKRTDGKVTITANCGTPIREKSRGISWMSSSS